MRNLRLPAGACQQCIEAIAVLAHLADHQEAAAAVKVVRAKRDAVPVRLTYDQFAKRNRIGPIGFTAHNSARYWLADPIANAKMFQISVNARGKHRLDAHEA